MADGSASVDVLGATAQGHLRSIIERVERLEVEKAEVADQIKEVFAEAKGNGFDVKILRKVIRLRRIDAAKRQEEEAITDLYMAALGELPLFERAAAEPGDGDKRIKIGFGDGPVIETTTAVLNAALDVLKAERVETAIETGEAQVFKGGDARRPRGRR